MKLIYWCVQKLFRQSSYW